MSAPHATVDLDDAEGLLEADRDGLLRAAAMAGAQVRATAAAVEEGALESVAGAPAAHADLGRRPRPGRNRGHDAGRVVRRGGRRADRGRRRVAAVDRAARRARRRRRRPRRSGAGRRGGDRRAPGRRRGRRRARTKARCATRPRAAPRCWRRGCGCPTSSGCAAIWPPVWPSCRPSTPALNSRSRRAGRRTRRRGAAQQRRPRGVHQPGQERWPSGCPAARWCWPATVRPPWRWPATARRCCCGSPHQPVAAVGLADAVVALRGGMAAAVRRARSTRCSTTRRSTGRCPVAPRVLALTLDAERPVVAARVAGLDDVDVVGAEDVGDGGLGRRCRRGVPNNSWRCWRSGWRWRRFT